MPLEIINISKSFNNRQILKNISLSIMDNEFVVFLGPSGCGKTTLLRIIAGLEKPDSGEIRFNDTILSNLEPKDRSIGMVFQNYALYPHLTVYDNIAFPLKVNKLGKKEIDKKVRDIAQFIGLNEYLNHKPKQLSGGQKQRVALGRAISRNPKIFLFDEPLSNLDAKLRSAMRFELYQLHKKLNTTSIYVTHDQVEAMTMGDRIVVINNGEIQQIATPMEIYERPANTYVASFIGNPQINFFEGIYNKNKGFVELNHSSIEFNLNLKNQEKITLGIRPENIILSEDTLDLIYLGNAVIQSIEYLGNESVINFDYDGELKTSLISNKNSFTIGKAYKVYTSKSKILIFDHNDQLIG